MPTILALATIGAVLIVLGVIAHGAMTWARDHRRRSETRALLTTRRGGRKC